MTAQRLALYLLLPPCVYGAILACAWIGARVGEVWAYLLWCVAWTSLVAAVMGVRSGK